MKINDYLFKPNWLRRDVTPRRFEAAPREVMPKMLVPMTFDRGKSIVMTQSDFLDELYPTSHKIHNVNYRSRRKKYRWDEGKGRNVFAGWQEVERVAVPMQAMILGKKIAHTFGSDIWLGNEGKEDYSSELIKIKSHWLTSGMKAALMQFGFAAFGSGDSAIYIYREDEEIKYKIFSYENGDNCTVIRAPETGEETFVRMFNYEGKQAVELYDSQKIQLWVKKDGEDLNDETFPAWLKKKYKQAIGTESEDGFILVSENAHRRGICPVIYHRENDVCWWAGQSTIERVENILSDLAENNKYYAFQILFLIGGAMTLPNADYQGKVFGSKSEKGDAKILEPADCSNSFTLDLQYNLDYLFESTFTTVVKPQDLKGGDYSGAYLRNLYFREVQWSMQAMSRLDPFMKRLLRVFIGLVGEIEGKTLEYSKIRISYRIDPFIPQNETEEAQILTSALNAGGMSVKTFTEEFARSNPREYDRILEDIKNGLIKSRSTQNTGQEDKVEEGGINNEDKKGIDNQNVNK
ncbi:hypothetical protein PF672P2_00028 [Parabacteroides phage PF672P2]|nr:hypothetical protein PF672P2_00028 [Parabacteroides phage PF672P2]